MLWPRFETQKGHFKPAPPDIFEVALQATIPFSPATQGGVALALG